MRVSRAPPNQAKIFPKDLGRANDGHVRLPFSNRHRRTERTTTRKRSQSRTTKRHVAAAKNCHRSSLPYLSLTLPPRVLVGPPDRSRFLSQSSICIMALRNFVSKLLLPNMENDIGRAMKSSISTMKLDMSPPLVYAFPNAGIRQGAFQTSGLKHAANSTKDKITYSVKTESLFADRPSWH